MGRIVVAPQYILVSRVDDVLYTWCAWSGWQPYCNGTLHPYVWVFGSRELAMRSLYRRWKKDNPLDRAARLSTVDKVRANEGSAE
jgi:hypothetical protein